MTNTQIVTMSNASSNSLTMTSSGTPLSPDYPVDILSNVRNPRGIPTMMFFEDPASVLSSKNAPVDAVLQSLQTMHSKFKLMEGALIETRKRCKAQIPDLESSLSVVVSLLLLVRNSLIVKNPPLVICPIYYTHLFFFSYFALYPTANAQEQARKATRRGCNV